MVLLGFGCDVLSCVDVLHFLCCADLLLLAIVVALLSRQCALLLVPVDAALKR